MACQLGYSRRRFSALASLVPFSSSLTSSLTFHSLQIFSFTFKCYECKGQLVVQTNPKDADYDFISGIRRKVQAFDTKEAGSMGYFDTNNISQIKDKVRLDEERRTEGCSEASAAYRPPI